MEIIMTLWIGNGAIFYKFQSIAIKRILKKKKKKFMDGII